MNIFLEASFTAEEEVEEEENQDVIWSKFN